jgi:hypothetical protein
MAVGKKQGERGVMQGGDMQLFGKGARATKLLEEIEAHARRYGVSLERAAEHLLEKWAVGRTAGGEGYANGVVRAEVVVVGQEGGPWPKDA